MAHVGSGKRDWGFRARSWWTFQQGPKDHEQGMGDGCDKLRLQFPASTSQTAEAGDRHSNRNYNRHKRDCKPGIWITAVTGILILFYLGFNNTRSSTTMMMMTTTEEPMPSDSLGRGGRSRDLATYTKSIFLPYYNTFSSKHTPTIDASINGVRMELPIDTGSTGLLLGAPHLPDLDPNEGVPGHTYLSSSRILYTGRLVEVSIRFHGKGGSHADTRIPVLVVYNSVVCPWYDPVKDTFACPYNPNEPKPKPRDLSRIAYMGVGFGRNGPEEGKPIALPRFNPFLNIQSVNGEEVCERTMRQGYTISTDGVYLGLTERNTRGFAFKDLEPGWTHDEDPRDWAMVGMCFSLNNQSEHCGPALIDTGIAQMYLRTGGVGSDIPTITVPNPNPNGYAKFVKRVKPGTKIAVEFPSSSGIDEEPVEEYSFRVGEGALNMEPTYVVPSKRKSPAYINTGRNFLFGCSIAFDAEGGRFGFRRVASSSSL